VERSAAASILDVDAGALANEVLDNLMVVLLSSIMQCYRSLILLFRRMRLHVHICSSFHQRFDAPATPTATHKHETELQKGGSKWARHEDLRLRGRGAEARERGGSTGEGRKQVARFEGRGAEASQDRNTRDLSEPEWHAS
jgi:hypothetical protein